ncbi:MAG: DsbA family protein [Alphaproteobacteria bacterium]|nr:DsbA family protein [Alphaproteobacteria bacterium]
MRRRVHVLASIAFLLAAVMSQTSWSAPSADPASALDPRYDHSLGSPTAPVTVVEFASVGCPHCAAWANTAFPSFKARFIDTGKVRFILREMITGDPSLAVAGFLVANCAPEDRFFPIIDAIFADQEALATGGGAALYKVAQTQSGMSVDAFSACLTDDKQLNALETQTDAVARAHGVDATPTFFVGGEKLEGDVTLDALGAAIARAESASSGHR